MLGNVIPGKAVQTISLTVDKIFARSLRNPDFLEGELFEASINFLVPVGRPGAKFEGPINRASKCIRTVPLQDSFEIGPMLFD
jgi:hypothetical protein